MVASRAFPRAVCSRHAMRHVLFGIVPYMNSLCAGYGDIVPQNLLETVVALLAVMVGGLTYPAVVGSIAPLVSSLNEAAEARIFSWPMF